MSVRELLVKFGGKTDPSLGKSAGDASGQIDKVGNAAERNSKKSQGAFGAIGGGAKAMIGPIAAAAATIGGIDFLKGAIEEARESQKVGAVTEQIIKSTGGAAKISAEGVGALATAISNKTGIDDEQIQSAANLLLTFKNVRNETGKGADIFNRATMAAQDLAAAGFGDAEGQAKMLGKALNDPVKGITALTRSGVTFTDQQKKQIKALQESGDLLGAQKIIMQEVESQVGGVAAKSATAGEKLATMWGNTKEQIGTMMLPALDAVQNALMEKVLPAVTDTFEWIDRNAGPVIDRFKGIADGVGGVWSILTKGDFKGGMFGLEEDSPIVDLIFRVREGIVALPGAMRRFGDQAKPVLDLVVGGARALWSGFQENILPAILEVSRRFQGFGAVVQPIIAQVFGRAMELAREWGPTISGYVTQVTQIVGSAFEFIGVIVGAVTRVVKGLWDRWGAGLISVGSAVFGALMKIIGGALNIIQGIIKTVMSVIRGDWSGAWEGIKKIGSGAMSVLRGIFDGGMAVITGVFRAGRDLVLDIWNKLRDGVSEKTGQARDWVVEKFTKMKTGIVDLFTGIGDTIGKKFDGIKEGIAKPLRSAATWLNDNILTPMNNVTSKFGVSIPQLPKFHQGGEIPGRGELPIMALGGEGMLNRDGMRRIGGKRTLDKLNKGHIGGILDWIKKPAKWIEDTARNGLAWGIEKLFGAVPDLSSSFPPPMAGQLLAGTVNSMKSAALGWARGKDEAEKAATATTATLPGGRAWPANTRALSGNYPGHSGVDIAAGPGSPIYAAASGPIAYAGWGRGYGQAIFQTIGSGLQAVYGHSSRVRVQQGQNVAAGQLIGDVGSTGRSSGPHLHFEVNSAGPFGSASNRNATLKWLGFDSGGWLPPGMTPTFNGTGKPEAILTAEQWERLFEALEGLANGDRRAVVDGQSLKEAMREEVRRTVTIHTGGGTLR